jgi:hypothetical protein
MMGALFVALLIAVLPFAPALAQGAAWTETFDDASLPGWERPPEVTVADGVLRVPAGGFAVRFGSWPEGTLSVRVKIPADAQAVIGYAFRDSGYYRLSLSLHEVILEKVGGESASLLGAGSAAAISSDAWVDVEVIWSGSEHRVSLGGAEVLRAAEDQPLPGGGIMLRAEGAAPVEYDSVSLKAAALAEMVPPPGETQPGEGPIDPPPGEAPGEGPGPAAVAPPSTPTPTPTPSGLAGLIAQLGAQRADPLQLSTVAVNLALAALFAFLLGRAYVFWGASLSNRRAFAANFLLITVTTTFIILVVRSSVALSLGLVGALSIVRFRAAIKEPEELAYLFFAIGIGIGLGDNQRLLTTLALIAGLILIGLMHVFRRGTADVNLHLTVAGSGAARVELDRVMETLKKYCTKARLMRFDENGERMETSFLVELRRLDDLQAACNALRQLSPGLEITFLDNRGVG